jgi:hypothetical protein
MAQKTKSDTSETILTLGLELSAVALFTIIAGFSDDAGTFMILWMVGLWLIYMVSDSAVIAGFSNAIANIASQA